MLSKKYKVIFSVCLIFLIVLSSCKKKQIECIDAGNPACPNYNPCYKKTNADASFITMEGVGGQGFEADTISCDHPVVFYAKNKLNTGNVLSWRIQSGSYTQTLNASYSSLYIYNPYNLSGDTVVYFYPYYEPTAPVASFYTVTCFSNLNNGSCSTYKTVDSVKKIFYMWPREFPNNNYTSNPPNTFHYKPIWGTYAGYKQSNPSKLVYVTLFDTVFVTPFACGNINAGAPIRSGFIKNLAYNNYSSQNFDKIFDNFPSDYYNGASAVVLNNYVPNTMYFYSNNTCYTAGSHYQIAYVGFAMLDYTNSKKIYINYAFQDTLSMNWISDYFVGYKVN